MGIKTFSFNQLVVVLLFATFLSMFVSGFALYIQPTGKIAFWTGWTFLGMEKDDWANLHILFVLTFLLTAIIHIYSRWKSLKNALVGGDGGRLPSREVVFALSLVVVLVFSGVYRIPPLSYVLDGKDYLREVWFDDKRDLPPLWQADEASFEDFCLNLGIKPDAAIKELNDAGYVVHDPSKKFSVIARKNNTSPLVMYEIIKKFQTKKKRGGR